MIRVAVAGVHGQGIGHLDTYTVMPNVRVVRIVDPDSRLFASRIKLVEEKGHNTPTAVQDIRSVLDDKDVDVCFHRRAESLALADHHLGLPGGQGRVRGEAAEPQHPRRPHRGGDGRKHNRIVQHGTGTRSNLGRAKTLAAIASGKLGKLLVSRGLCYKTGEAGKVNTRGDIGFAPPKDPPRGLDFNIWLGPAREQAVP